MLHRLSLAVAAALLAACAHAPESGKSASSGKRAQMDCHMMEARAEDGKKPRDRGQRPGKMGCMKEAPAAAPPAAGSEHDHNKQ